MLAENSVVQRQRSLVLFRTFPVGLLVLDGLLVNGFDRAEVSSIDPTRLKWHCADRGLVLAPWAGVHRDHPNSMTMSR